MFAVTVRFEEFSDYTGTVAGSHLKHEHAQERLYGIGADVHPSSQLLARESHRDAQQYLLFAIAQLVIYADLVYCIHDRNLALQMQSENRRAWGTVL